jgi:hypothetical protein
MTELAVVFGLCALSFAAGCVLTAVMLRRDQPPEHAPEPVEDPPAPRFEPRFPPEEYATRPIHRNPVMGLPTALPTPVPARPNLVLVPRPATERPVGRDEVRLHVVRNGTEPEHRTGPEPKPGTAAGVEPTGTAPVEATKTEPVQTEPVQTGPAKAEDVQPEAANTKAGKGIEPVVVVAQAGPEPVLAEVPADATRPKRPAGGRTGGGPPNVNGSERSGS